MTTLNSLSKAKSVPNSPRSRYKIRIRPHSADSSLYDKEVVCIQQALKNNETDASAILLDEVDKGHVVTQKNAQISASKSEDNDSVVSEIEEKDVDELQPEIEVHVITDAESSHSTQEDTSKSSEYLDHELLIKGYQLENEKAIVKIKSLEDEISVLKETVTKEQQKSRRQLLEANLERKEHENKASTKEALILQLQQDSIQFKEVTEIREREMQSRINALCREKKVLESQLAGLDLDLIEKDDGVVKEIKQEMEAMKKAHKEEMDTLQEKLSWYAENQDLLNSKEALLEEQSTQILVLQRQLDKREGGSKQQLLNKNKQLEEDLRCMKEVLSAKNPDSVTAIIQAAKSTPEETEEIRSLKAKVKELEDALKQKDVVYEMELRSLRQQHEKLKLVSSSGPKIKTPANARSRDAVSILKDKHSKELRRLQDRLKEFQKTDNQRSDKCSPSRFALSALQQQIEKNKKLELLLAKKSSQTEDQDSEALLFRTPLHKETQTVDNSAMNRDLESSFFLMKEAHNEAVEKLALQKVEHQKEMQRVTEDHAKHIEQVKEIVRTEQRHQRNHQISFLQQELDESRHRVNSLEAELVSTKRREGWSPGKAEFEAMERKITVATNRLETREKEYRDSIQNLERVHEMQLKSIEHKMECERKAQELTLDKYKLQVAEILEAAQILKQNIL